MTTAITTLTGWIPLVYLHKGSAVPVGFVSQLPHQFAPIGVADGFSQSLVFDHVFNAQTFTANHLVFVYQLGGELVGKVSAAIGNLCLNACDFLSGFVKVGRAFLFLRKAALRQCQLSCVVRSVMGITRLEPVSGNNKVSQTQINARGAFANGQWFRLETAQHRHEVTVCAVFCDGDSCRFAGQVTRPANIKRLLAFGNVNLAVFVLERRLGELRALVTALLFESGVLSAAFKEVFKGGLLMAQRLLQRNARYRIQPLKFREFFNLCEFRASSVVVDFLSVIVKRIGTPFKDFVEHKPDATKRLRKQLSLFRRWVEALFNGDFFHISQTTAYFCECE